MPEIRGFRALRYAANKVDSYSDVITPPFDVIGEDEQARLRERSPYNYVHLILPKAVEDGSPYEAAAALLRQWQEEGVLVRENVDAVYVLKQQFKDMSGEQHERTAFFAAIRIPESNEKYVLGHERTFQHKITDRLALTSAVQANTGAVFSLYDDADGAINTFLQGATQGEPDMEATTFEGVLQRVWVVPADKAPLAAFADKTLYIADGHHRFATACAYRDQMRKENPGATDQPWDYLLMGLVAFEDPGLMVYAAHRGVDLPEGLDEAALLEKVSDRFEIEAFAGDIPEAIRHAEACVVGLVLKTGASYLLRLKDGIDRAQWFGEDHGPAWRALDVAVLHRGILENELAIPVGTEFVYEPDAHKALALATEGKKDAVFFTRPATVQQIRACADAGEYMPQKATYLFPKLCSGAVINPLWG